MKTFLILLVGSLISITALAATPFEAECDKIAKSNAPDSKRLHDLFKASWKHDMTEHPEYATFVGFPGVNDRWADLSPEAIAKRKKEAEAPMKALRSINRANLNAQDKLSHELFESLVEEDIRSREFPEEYLQVSQLEGIQQSVAQVLNVMPLESVKDYRDIIARLEKTPRLISQTQHLLEQGLKKQVTPPKITLRDVPEQLNRMAEPEVEKNPLYAGFKNMPESIPASEREKLQSQAKQVISEKVIPAFKKFTEFFSEAYIPACRESIAWSDLPNGREWYAHRVRHFTTTRLSPDEIHKIGLSEVKRIRQAMNELMVEVNFKGSFEEFKKFLRTDSRFYFSEPDELLKGYRDIAKRIDPELPRLFGTLPRTPYGVVPVPSYAEKSQTTAYYEPGSLEAGRGGNFFANTYNLKMRPKWEMEALTLHEAVPGHHLQISLAQELGSLPDFRRNAGYTAFVEGWGLYAESLGKELKLYSDPYSRFGQLTYEMWRAVRLVVDTGMHSKGWTRQQAIDFFKENASKTEHDIVVEVDRYIVLAGQALAYKIGQLKFKELRELARTELGERFDIRAFHDTALGNGALPLDTLERKVREWIASVKRKKPKA